MLELFYILSTNLLLLKLSQTRFLPLNMGDMGDYMGDNIDIPLVHQCYIEFLNLILNRVRQTRNSAFRGSR